MKNIISLLCILALTSCDAGPGNEVELDCPSIKNLDAVLGSASPEIIIVGEIHGMKETPELVTAMVCHSLSAGYKTNLALEIDDGDGAHQTYFESSGSDQDLKAYFEDETWTNPFVDGRSSQAKLELIEYARSLRHSQYDFSVTWFRTIDYGSLPEDDPSARSQAIEKQMADNILQGIEYNRPEKTIVLTGNLHARTDKSLRANMTYDYMASHLTEFDMMTFDTGHNGGSSWHCRSPSVKDCKEYKSGSRYKDGNTLLSSEDFEILLNGDERLMDIRGRYSPDVFDGIIHLGTVEASPPANMDGRDNVEDTE